MSRRDRLRRSTPGTPKQVDVGQAVDSVAYLALLDDVTARVSAGRVRAVLAANRELVLLYWEIGQAIVKRQADLGWGAKVVRRLSEDLRAAFPEVSGFSVRNLKYMRAFALAWPDHQIVQQAVAQIPWGHNVLLLDKVADPDVRLVYAHLCIEHGWSRAVLAAQIETRLHDRQGQAVTNFDQALPTPTSDLAQAALKDPYVFEFLDIDRRASERDLERALIDRVQEFLLELGVGFAFVGRQFRIEVGGDEFLLDLLFYHLKLRCFVVIELKAVPFKPEFVGKLNFYLAAVDDQLRHPQDAPSIGLLLCKEKNRVVVEYALRGMGRPVGVASWEAHAGGLPGEVAKVLPSADVLARELGEGH